MIDFPTTVSSKYQHIRDGLKWKVGFLRSYDKLRIKGIVAKFKTDDKKAAQLNRWRYKTEHEILSDLLTELGSEDIFYDVGANTGLYSMFAAKVCEEVIAFEPYPPNARYLAANAQLNNVEITIIERALSNQEENVEFNMPDETKTGYGGASISPEGSKGQMEAVKGDNLIKSGEIPPPTIVKVDVEGAKPLVLEGLSNALSNSRCRLLYCEIHQANEESRPSVEDFGASPEQTKQEIERFGFDIEREVKRDDEIHVKAAKTHNRVSINTT